MGDSRRIGEELGGEERQGALGEGKGDNAVPGSEEGGTGTGAGDEGGSTHLPASEEDSGLIEEDRAPRQSWPGGGGPRTLPPPD
jgi:hypothetical protein